MKSRRSGVLALTSGGVALAVLVLPALADELLGRVKSVDVAAKKVVVTEKGSLTDHEMIIPDEAVIETAKGEKVALKELKKGDRVRVTYEVEDEEDVVSKIVVKAAAKTQDDPKGKDPTRP